MHGARIYALSCACRMNTRHTIFFCSIRYLLTERSRQCNSPSREKKFLMIFAVGVGSRAYEFMTRCKSIGSEAHCLFTAARRFSENGVAMSLGFYIGGEKGPRSRPGSGAGPGSQLEGKSAQGPLVCPLRAETAFWGQPLGRTRSAKTGRFRVFFGGAHESTRAGSTLESTTGTDENTSGTPENTRGPPESTTGPPESTTGPPESTSGPPESTSGPPESTTGPDESTSGPPGRTTGLAESTTGPTESTRGPPAGGHLRAPRAHRRAPRAHLKAPAAHLRAPGAHLRAPRAHPTAPRAHQGAT